MPYYSSNFDRKSFTKHGIPVFSNVCHTFSDTFCLKQFLLSMAYEHQAPGNSFLITKTTRKVKANTTKNPVSIYRSNLPIDSRGLIFFCRYLLNKYTGMREASIINNIARALSFISSLSNSLPSPLHSPSPRQLVSPHSAFLQ